MSTVKFSDNDEHSSEFIEALKQGDIQKIKEIPKSDLHNHSPLGVRFRDFSQRHEGEVPPPPDYMNGLEALADYLDRIVGFMNTREEIEFLVDKCLETACEDGVQVLEASIDATFLQFYDSHQEFFAFIRELEEKFFPEMEFRPELGVARILPEESWETYVPPCLESGVFQSIDLYDQESVNNLDLYSKYYRKAHAKDLKIKVHVGEFCEPQQIKETIEELDPEVIQHGITAIESDEVMQMIRERNIILNMAPTSNVKLGAVEKLSDHPLPEFYDRDIPVTINTDDLMIFDSSVSEEFLKVFKAGLLSAEELDHIRRIGLYG